MVVGRHKRSIICNNVEKCNKSTQQQTIKETNSIKPIIENNMGAYMERIVESLVMNNNPSSQNLLINQSQKINETVKEPSLSYNQVIFFLNYLIKFQIKCLENVNRLIKSIPQNGGEEESDGLELPTKSNLPFNLTTDNTKFQTKLTQKILQKHDLRCELECKDNWKRRLIRDLSLKRIAKVKKF